MKRETQKDQLLASLTIKKETIYSTKKSASNKGNNGFLGLTQTSGLSTRL